MKKTPDVSQVALERMRPAGWASMVPKPKRSPLPCSRFMASAAFAVFLSTNLHAWRNDNIVSSVDELKTVLTRMNTNGETYDYVTFENGTYDLSALSETPFGDGYLGKAILQGPIGTIWRSRSGNPDDVILDAKGTGRILIINSGAEAQNLTFRNGNAQGLTSTARYNCGGAIATTGGADSFVKNCRFISCEARFGGAIGRVASVEGCVFSKCSSSGGGAVSDVKIVKNCAFVGNLSTNDWCEGGAAYACGLVAGCTAVSNSASIGGAFSQCNVVSNSIMRYNLALRKGGGAAKSFLVDCTNEFNCAEAYAGAGGAVDCDALRTYFNRNGAYHCGLSDRPASGVYSNCEFRVSAIAGATLLENCVIRDVTNEVVTIWNVAGAVPRTNDVRYVFEDCRTMRNCLVHENRLCRWDNRAIFYSAWKDGGTTTVENCTFADNKAIYLMRSYNGKRSILLTNCVIVRNVDPNGDARDVSTYESQNNRLDTCIWNTNTAAKPTDSSDFEDVGCMSLGAGVDPRFVGTGLIKGISFAPYTPRRSSPIRRMAGKTLDWMDGTTLDLAGNLLMKDGCAPIGCYQCYCPAYGFTLNIR